MSFSASTTNETTTIVYDVISGRSKITSATVAPTIEKYRINTPGCKISELPLFDEETRDLFEDYPETVWRCKPSKMHIIRYNETCIHLDWYPLNYTPLCYYRSLGLNPKGDKRNFVYGRA